ncbi:hypothetical protein Tco_0696345 [Tanacetum coccineum]
MEALIKDENGKKTKRRRTKESKSSKKQSTTKETPKGKALSKGFKTGKSASTKEPVEEPIAEVVMDDAGDDVFVLLLKIRENNLNLFKWDQQVVSELVEKKNSNSTQDLLVKEKMESRSETTQTVSALKLPVLKTREYDLWSIRMEQYLTFTDHALWEVIVNGDLVIPVASASVDTEAIHDEHLLTFHSCKDAKSLWESIKNRFGGNKESKKMQKTILKQNYENFEDANLKLLRSLPSAWNNIALIMRNKSDLDALSMDDLYNNLKVTKEIVNTAHSVFAASFKDQASTKSYADDVIFSFFANQSNAPQLDNEDLE